MCGLEKCDSLVLFSLAIQNDCKAIFSIKVSDHMKHQKKSHQLAG